MSFLCHEGWVPAATLAENELLIFTSGDRVPPGDRRLKRMCVRAAGLWLRERTGWHDAGCGVTAITVERL